MKNNKFNIIINLFIIICTTILILFLCINISNASGEIPTNAKIGDWDDPNVNNFAGIIIGIMQWVGSAVAVIMVIVNGIKYLTSSVDDKAEYKKTAIYYAIGGILVFSAVNILSIIYSVFN